MAAGRKALWVLGVLPLLVLSLAPAAAADPVPTPTPRSVGASERQWTYNPRLVKSKGGWRARAFRWDSLTGKTWDPVPNGVNDYGIWAGDGDVRLGARDVSWWNTVNDGAWVTQEGPPLRVDRVSSLTLRGRLPEFGTTPSYLGAWTGIKFDVWLRDTTRDGRLLYIEMYFLRTGLNELWCADFLKLEENCHYELARYLTLGTIDDYMLHIPAFEGTTCVGGRCLPALADVRKMPDGSTLFRVDLRAVIERGARHFGRTLDGYEMTSVGATLESGEILVGLAGSCSARVSEIRVTYRPL